MEELKLRYTNSKELAFSTRSCAILWANWTWKSSFSKKILQLNNSSNKIQPISAQRNLTFKQWSLKWSQDDDLDQKVFWFSSASVWKLDKRHLGHYFEETSHNNLMQDDFNENIEKLYRDDMYLHANASRRWLDKPSTNAERIFNIWNWIFLSKNIGIAEDWKIKITSGRDESISSYEIENLSDWERSALYLITKCIYAPSNWIIIVDEWETHLNSALLHDLWDSIEKARHDCRFIYISHNIDFVTSRNDCTKFWVRWFNHPLDWEIEEIENDNLPEELILQIIGTKKEKILFVEWEKWGENILYQKIYHSLKVIPVGGCKNVTDFTKALNKSPQTYNKKYYWLIDRDFKNESHIKSIERDWIFSLPVAEYENLFFREEVVRFIFTHLWRTDFDDKFKKMKDELFKLKNDKKFKEDYYKSHIQERFNQELEKYKIGNSFKFEDDYQELNLEWEKIEQEENLNEFLKSLNAKDYWLKWTPVNVLGLWNWGQYKEMIINIFNTDKKEEFRKIFLEFMPKI